MPRKEYNCVWFHTFSQVYNESGKQDSAGKSLFLDDGTSVAVIICLSIFSRVCNERLEGWRVQRKAFTWTWLTAELYRRVLQFHRRNEALSRDITRRFDASVHEPVSREVSEAAWGRISRAVTKDDTRGWARTWSETVKNSDTASLHIRERELCNGAFLLLCSSKICNKK